MKCYLTSNNRAVANAMLEQLFDKNIYTDFQDEGLIFVADIFEESDDFDSQIRLNFHVICIDEKTGKELFSITPNHFAYAEIIKRINTEIELVSRPEFHFSIRLLNQTERNTEWCELSIHRCEQNLTSYEDKFEKNILSNVQWGCADEQ